MITEIRDYINKSIKEVDSDLIFDDVYFDSENISSARMDDYYKIILGPLAPDRLDVLSEATFSLDVLIYSMSGTNRVEKYDRAYCRAVEIYSKILDQKRMNQEGFIKTIGASTITPEEVESGDNAIRMRISLNVTIFYATED